MTQKTFNNAAGAIFLAIAIMHALRLFYGWNAVIGGWTVPMWVSSVALVAAGGLALSVLRLAGRHG